MGITERRLRQKEEVRISILRAAWNLVETEGWQALSIRKIADAIEYSVPVIYDHFENKEAILLEFTRDGFRKLNDHLLDIKKKSDDPSRQLELMAGAYCKFASENSEYYQLMYGLGMPSCDTVRQIPELQRFTELILDSIKKLIASEGVQHIDPFLKFHTFWSMLHGMISINMMGGAKDKNDYQPLVDDFIRGFVAGIKE